MHLFHRTTLGAAGLTALGVGLAVALAPEAFYAGYGIAVSADPVALSERRAPGASLAALGAAIFAGALTPAHARACAALGGLVFFGFAAGRLAGIALDGWPGWGIASALAIELLLGGLCLAAWRAAARAGESGGGRNGGRNGAQGGGPKAAPSGSSGAARPAESAAPRPIMLPAMGA